MQFSLLSLAALVVPSLGVTHFAGLGASNSVGHAHSYTCRTQAEWNLVAETAKIHGFRSIRVTGFDCDALYRASAAAEAVGVKVLAGIWISGTVASSVRSIDNDVNTFYATYKNFGAKRYVGLTVGNEVSDTPGNIMAKVHAVRSYLRSHGVITPVSTVHVWVTIRDNPALCGGDFVAANAHAFWDGNRQAHQAGDFVFSTVVPSLRDICPGKKIVITESGWPSKGTSHGIAQASYEDQRIATISLNCAAKNHPSVSLYSFEFDDQLWKDNDNERSFGMFGKLNMKGDVLKQC